jgi:hypothetical protein
MNKITYLDDRSVDKFLSLLAFLTSSLSNENNHKFKKTS